MRVKKLLEGFPGQPLFDVPGWLGRPRDTVMDKRVRGRHDGVTSRLQGPCHPLHVAMLIRDMGNHLLRDDDVKVHFG